MPSSNFSDPTVLIYSFSPSSDIDRTWARITARSIIGLAHEDITGIGKDPTIAVLMSPEGLITNYDLCFGRRWGFEEPIVFELHLRHCTDTATESHDVKAAVTRAEHKTQNPPERSECPKNPC
ncbi:hypothetical protein F5Y12DRAFT_710721 [Xylaria sp. FL1777]|nr:hypothetical protein F5Y12DRAFT_710721 [Xylaria sp. FL1777]